MTDCDLAARGLAEGKGAEMPLRELISARPSCCTPESDLGKVERIIAEQQVRRVPVIDDDGVVGLPRRTWRVPGGVYNREVGHTVERISEPTNEPRSGTDAGRHPNEMS